MGFKAGHIIDNKGMVDPNKDLPSSFSNTIQIPLDMDEIRIILESITQSKFQGSDLEKMYSLVLKLQNQYLILENFKKASQ
jgi:hypothetical protein